MDRFAPSYLGTERGVRTAVESSAWEERARVSKQWTPDGGQAPSRRRERARHLHDGLASARERLPDFSINDREHL